MFDDVILWNLMRYFCRFVLPVFWNVLLLLFLKTKPGKAKELFCHFFSYYCICYLFYMELNSLLYQSCTFDPEFPIGAVIFHISVSGW